MDGRGLCDDERLPAFQKEIVGMTIAKCIARKIIRGTMRLYILRSRVSPFLFIARQFFVQVLVHGKDLSVGER